MTRATPMLEQYLGIKADHPDAILFFRMGDFYEMFFEDAVEASRVLGITLTSRGVHQGEKVPMCGVPYHSAQSYVGRLVGEGRKVAICEQVEDPDSAKGIVRREVVRVVTPGSVTEDGEIEGSDNVFLAALASQDNRYGLAHMDFSTGEFRVTETGDRGQALGELERVAPAEVLVSEGDEILGAPELTEYRVEVLAGDDFDRTRAARILEDQLGVRSLAGFGCEGMDQAVIAAGAVVHYLRETQKADPGHVKSLVTYTLGGFMFLDDTTIRNLELFKSMRRDTVKGTLFHVLDRTFTPMGGRLLRRWIGYPLLGLQEINARLAAVECLREDRRRREAVREALKGIYDLERLNGRVALGRANARDLVALKDSLRRLPGLLSGLEGTSSELLSEISSGLDLLEDAAGLVEEAIRDEPPIGLKEGGIIREGYHQELDELIRITSDGKGWISDLASKEQKRTGIGSLKVGYNKIFGYYIEVSKANLDRVPEGYIRKQTLVGGERYITEELKRYEEKVLGAEEKRAALELELFESIRKSVARESSRIKKTAEAVGAIDVLAGLAEVAEEKGYTRPDVCDDDIIDIEDGRHPVIEETVRYEDFVPNDIHIDSKEQQLLIITGPNMAGKSTVLRQTALTVLMAQMGSFVPAARAVVGLVDRIFTRIGAADDLAQGRSTFMVEMSETANILRNATSRSLVILDEIGRGTSTYDGISIAWAVAETLHDREGKGVRTLFATHYHELTELLNTNPRAKNFNIAVKEWKDKIIFLRKLVKGGTSKSYGIQVARLAGIPEDVVERAKEILSSLERRALSRAGTSRRSRGRGDPLQLSLFAGRDDRLRNWIRELDINNITPMEALEMLNRLKGYVNGDRADQAGHQQETS